MGFSCSIPKFMVQLDQLFLNTHSDIRVGNCLSYTRILFQVVNLEKLPFIAKILKAFIKQLAQSLQEQSIHSIC